MDPRMCPGTAGTLSGTWCGVAARAGESIPEGVSRARATTLTRLIVELVRYGPLDDRNVTCGREDDNNINRNIARGLLRALLSQPRRE